MASGRKALLNDEILDAENIATIKLLNKPKHYYTLEALRKVYESKANLYEYLKLAAGMIEALPDKFNEIRNIFSEYKLTHPELNYEKLKWIENIFECYFTNSNYKNALISGDYSVLNNQSLGGVVNPAKITSTELLSAIKFLRNVEVNYVN